MALQIAVLVIDYEAISMPATSNQMIKTIRGIITMEALDPKTLLERFWPAAAEYLKNPKNFIGNLNPIVLIAIAVGVVGVAVGGVSLIIKKM